MIKHFEVLRKIACRTFLAFEKGSTNKKVLISDFWETVEDFKMRFPSHLEIRKTTKYKRTDDYNQH